MGDKVSIIMMLFGLVCVVVAAIYFFVLPKGNDVRKIDAVNQDHLWSASSSAKPTVAKTAQLSALRERLADAQTSSTGLKKMPGRPVAEQPKQPKQPESEKSWRPEDAGFGESQAVVLEVPEPAPIRVLKVEVPSSRVEAAQVAAPHALPVPRSAPVHVPLAEPVASARHEALAGEGRPSSASPIVAGPAKMHILLVDDSKVVRVKTEKLLLNKGYIVTTAIDGIDALAKLETLKPTLIITDIEMPNLDGFGLVRNVRGNARTAEIPVIVMTSHVNLHLDIAATEGINGFLPKPFNDQDLLDQVGFLCES